MLYCIPWLIVKCYLKNFLSFFGVELKKSNEIIISCQKQPFCIGDKSDTNEIDSIPDGWIIIDDNIAIVFEVKVSMHSIRKSQLRSHLRKIRERGMGQRSLKIKSY